MLFRFRFYLDRMKFRLWSSHTPGSSYFCTASGITWCMEDEFWLLPLAMRFARSYFSACSTTTVQSKLCLVPEMNN